MDANDTRYRSLVTAKDWTVEVHSEDAGAEWSEQLRGLSLKPRLFEFASLQGVTPPLDEPGRSGAFDSHGNLYSLSANRRVVRVRSTATRVLSDYWPVGEGVGVGAIEGLSPGLKRQSPTLPGSFGPQAPEPLAASYIFDALTVTRNNYLIVASREAGGLLIFDLFGGGPPLFQPWPAMRTWPASQTVTTLAAIADGGFLALAGNWIYRFGPTLKPLAPSVPADNTFAPVEVANRVVQNPSVERAGAPPCFIDLSPLFVHGATATALAVEGERLVVLSSIPREGNILTYVSVLNLDGQAQDLGRGQAKPVLHLELTSLVAEATQLGRLLPLGSYTLGVATLVDTELSFFVPLRQGDQVLRFVVTSTGTECDVRLAREFWPLRRYEGLGFAVLPPGRQLAGYPGARAFYLNQNQWAPLLQLARPRFQTETVLLTPIWDGGNDGCEWHRLLMDMNLPSGTAVTLETRTCDGADRTAIEREVFRREPDLIRSVRGREQPWRDAEVEEIAQGFATWETLLQAAKGRWFQARLSVRGDGQRSPVLRSLRVWYPRFSYAKNYLPPVYREDAAGADFLDRFLALFEGEFTRWEDRIAAAQMLFDARTAPTATLEWLATWLGLAFDVADTDAVKRRLLIRHAVTGYSRRGSVLGMLSAATLAWERDIEEVWLSGPDSLLKRRNGVRLQEFFSQVGALPPSAWLPSNGRDALLTRLTPTTETTSAAAVDIALLVSDGDAARAASLQRALSFLPRAASEEARIWNAWQTGRGVTNGVPGLPSDEPSESEQRSNWDDYLRHTQSCAPLRQRWQDFLSRRYRRIAALNADWGTSWSGFERIPSPILVPRAQAALEAWHRFETRVLRGHTHAHRFRVVLPLPRESFEVDELLRRRDSVRRVVEREKPAHTVAEVRFGFELFRVGEARLGRDTQLEEGLSRRPELQAMSRAILGRTELGGSKLEQVRPLAPPDRVGLNRRESLNR